MTDTLPAIEVRELDWQSVRYAAQPDAVRARIQEIVPRMEALMDQPGGPGLLFDHDRAAPDDRAIQAAMGEGGGPLWIIGDLHGDLLALESALAQIEAFSALANGLPARIVLLGDFADDEGFGLEVLLRVWELMLQAPGRVTFVAGNHDEALTVEGDRFAATVSPADFADFLNANLANEWIARAGRLAVRLAQHAPRALFLPDGLLITHGGFPLVDLHANLEETGNWNDPLCLADFTWARCHPKARRKMPNRFSRGSQFGYEDFKDFCALSTRLGRPVARMVRGHDHVDERFAIPPAYQGAVLTTVALSRRLPREQFGPHERAPTMARWVKDQLPQVVQLHIPHELIHEFFPPPAAAAPDEPEMARATEGSAEGAAAT